MSWSSSWSLLIRVAASNVPVSFDVVDIFDGINGRWTTAALSVSRSNLAATSLPNQGLAMFAGGSGIGMYIRNLCLFKIRDF